MRLKGRIALVTGGSRGIGKTIALALAQEGAKVAINYQSNESAARDVARLVEKIGSTAFICKADVSSFADTLKMRDQVNSNLGVVDILVNNAGITSDKTFLRMTHEVWRKVLSVNLDGVYNCTKVFLDGMLEKRWGRIVNITSVIGQIGSFGQANYAASKAGVMAMTKTLAKELARKGITVNAVAPGFIETEMVGAIPEKVKERLTSQIPLGRFGLAEEVAGAVVFLVSSGGDYVTGHELSVNGGLFV
ncbi:MAG: 3-oxoacyl-[acyl-carrier-protein] reductase [Candidatus Methylomirabilaceae bacterium]